MTALTRRFALPLLSSGAFIALLAGLGQPLEAATPAPTDAPAPVEAVAPALATEALAMQRQAARMRWRVTLPSVGRRRCFATC